MRGDRAHHDDGTAMAFGDHLLGRLSAYHPSAADIGFEEVVEILDRRRVPGHEGIDGGIRNDIVEAAARFATSFTMAVTAAGSRMSAMTAKGLPASFLDQSQRLARIAGRLLVDADQRAL